MIVTSTAALRTKSEAFNFQNPQMDPFELKALLERELVEKKGLGLAAPQLGIALRVFSIANATSLPDDPHATIFNPRIVDKSSEMVELMEGCLSYPGVFMKIVRPRMIKVRFAVASGEVRTGKFDGMTARIFQHELDHLDGVLFFDHVSKLKQDMAAKKAKKKGFEVNTHEWRNHSAYQT